MDCKNYWEMISEEIDGELEESKSLFLMRHLVACEDCIREYKTGFRIRDMLEEENLALPVLVPDGFSKEIVDILESEAPLKVSELTMSEKAVSRPRSKFFSIFNVFPLLPKPAIQLSFALSLILIVSLTFFYNKSVTDISTQPSLLNAKGLEPKNMEQPFVGKGEEEDELNYYVTRHAAAVNSRRVHAAIVHRNENLSYVTYSPMK